MIFTYILASDKVKPVSLPKQFISDAAELTFQCFLVLYFSLYDGLVDCYLGREKQWQTKSKLKD